ncbi:unnamed protein product [Ambrosiozyma monospora]|uniref:Unnamed protein product n=1 Tax=Ambrosiozyma monospora TaxID=43982 RepID=A0ACB5STG7_AMBMO|nr:unnamed protein product [Ambrosiozyma monospora]
MSFNKQFQRPAQATTSTSTSPSKGFVLPSQPVASLSESTVSVGATTSSSSPLKTKPASPLINYLEQFDTSNGASSFSSTPSKPQRTATSNIPTLGSLIGDDEDSSKPKAKELISALTYETGGDFLNEESSDSESEDDGPGSALPNEKIGSQEPKEGAESDSLDDLLNAKDEQDSILQKVQEDANAKKHKKEEPVADVVEADSNVKGGESAPPNLIDIEEDKLTKTSKPTVDTTETPETQNTETKDKKNKSSIPNPPTASKQKPFDFQKFLRMFKTRQCEPIHKYLRSFLYQYNQKNWTIDEQVKLIKDFENFLFDKMQQYPPFDGLKSESELDNCKEGIEKLVMTRTYSTAFSPVVAKAKQSSQHADDLAKDRQYNENVKLYHWLELKHLDVPMNLNVESNFVKLASSEINKINNYKSPRDKIICILNCCKIIFGLIRQQQKLQKIEENADSFVPLLIYVLLQAKTKFLYSNLMYIERFRNEEFLVGEPSYYVSTLQLAVNFIIDLDFEKLSIEKNEYDSKLSSAREQLVKDAEARKKQKEQQQHLSPDLLAPIPKKITELIGSSSNESPSQVLTKSAELMKQGFSNFFNSPTGSPAGNNAAPSNENESTQLTYKEELQQIKQLSLQENEQLERRRQQEEDNFKVLVSMFPNLDEELIRDVLASDAVADGASNIGSCVDALLALSS